jgi:cell filamentation protein
MKSALPHLAGARSAKALDRRELLALDRMMTQSLTAWPINERITARDICTLHRDWLGGIHEWAGEYRQVNLSKDGFMFAAASRVPALMHGLERDLLSRYTPCNVESTRDLARLVAEVHAELVLIHPFRDGNGRLARHVANLMVWQSGRPPIDFEAITQSARMEYFAAIRAALDRSYEPIQLIFDKLIASSSS